MNPKPYALEFEIEDLPKLPNQLMYKHWTFAHGNAKKWKTLVRMNVHYLRPKDPLHRARLVLTRFSSNEPDFDGLAGSFKPVIDGLVAAKVLVDDKSSNIGQPTYKWEKCKRGEGFIKVEVYGEPLEECA